jgi:hypothetical protein
LLEVKFFQIIGRAHEHVEAARRLAEQRL